MIFFYLFISYAVLKYPAQDLNGAGIPLIISSGNRIDWWFSKCLWTALSVEGFFLVGLMAATIWVVATHGAMCGISSDQVLYALGFDMSNLAPEPWSIVAVLGASVFAAVSVAIVQTVVSLLSKPIWGFVCTSSLLFLSAFVGGPFLVGSYLMAARSEIFVAGGNSIASGIALSAMIIVLSVLVGATRFQNMDLLGNGD